MHEGPTHSPVDLTIRTADAEATRDLGAALARAARPLPPDGLVVGLRGDLGAGKTVFAKGVAIGLGVPSTEAVVSPTFTIARSYDAADGLRLHHLDAYRLGNAAELEDIGFEDLRGTGCLTCVEWAERVADALPEDRIDAWIEMESPPRGEVEPGAVPRAPRIVRLRAEGIHGARVLRRLAEALRR